MTMNNDAIHFRFIEPLDVLHLRGNKLFGDPGSFGECLIPPWPSVAAGALRSAMLARDGVDLAAFAQGRVSHPLLGTPDAPGSFTVVGFTLARRLTCGQVESLHALPADLIAETDSRAHRAEAGTESLKLARLLPMTPVGGLSSSAPLAQWPVLPQAERKKPASGCWLTQAGWELYLDGQTPKGEHLVRTGELWQFDSRTGIGLDTGKRRAADGQLFTVQAVALRPDVGFLAAVLGAEPTAHGVLRFGGDGRGATICPIEHQASAINLVRITQARRARIVLTTPGLFAGGWKLPGMGADQRLTWPGLSARVACAAVPRGEVISGWDMAARGPKPAECVAPVGSVYWLEDIDATPDALDKLAAQGLWFDSTDNRQRRAEGFNRFTFAAW